MNVEGANIVVTGASAGIGAALAPALTARGATVAIPSRDAPGLCKAVMERDIVTSHRDDNVRASFHFYNNGDDIEALIAALVDLRPRFAPASA